MAGAGMKLITIWSFARDFISRKYLMYVASVTMCVLALLLLSVSLFSYTATQYGKQQCNRLFAKGAAGTGVFCFDAVGIDNTDDWPIFLSEVNQAEEIYAAGVYIESGVILSGMEDLVKLQAENESTIHDNGIPEDYLVIYSAAEEAIGLFNLKFQSRGYREGEEGVGYLYLGNNFSSVDVGTVYTDGNETYVVAGILEKGASIIDPQVLFRSSDVLELDYSVCLDNLVLVKDSWPAYNWVTFSVNEGYSVQQGLDVIAEIAKKYNMEIDGATCEGLLYRREVNNERLVSATRNILIWLLIVIFIIMLCIQVSDAIERSGEFGIMYANGSSVRDICLIVLMENVRRVLVSFVLWAVIAFLVCKKMVAPYYQRVYGLSEGIVMDILIRNIVPLVALFAAAYVLVMSVIPVIMVKRSQPVKLIGGYKV